MATKTKAQIDKEIRSAGESRVNFDGMTALNGNTWVGITVVDGVERYFEIKIVAKSVKFTADDIAAALLEREMVEARKVATKAAADAKRANDEKRRAEAKAKADAKKEAESTEVEG